MMRGMDPQAAASLNKVLDTKDYRLIAPIGKGGTATCYAVLSVRYNTLFCCKQLIVNNERICSDCEINALRQLNNPGIISMYDYWIERPYVYLFLELCQNGSLMDYIERHGPLRGQPLLGVCANLLQGLAYIHEHNFAHMDIKPANVLIDRYGRTKLADFGMSRLFKDRVLVEKQGGSMIFMAPEIVTDQRYDPFKADVWALGMTFYFICMGRPPWPIIDVKQVKEAIAKGIEYMPETMPPDMKQLIGAMCKLNPNERQTAQKLAHLPMFHGLQPRDGYLVVEKAKRPPPKTPSAHAARVSHAAKSTTSVGMMKVQAGNSRKNIISSIVTTVPAAKPGSVPLKMSKMMS